MNFQYNLFNEEFKTKNAEKHDRLRYRQNEYLDSHHHPQEKLKQLNKLDEYICKLINSENIDCFVVGYPVDLKNNKTDVTGHVKGFVKRLKNKYPNKKIYLIDERFTSKMAQKAIIESGIKKRKRREKSLVDKISATIILQDYLNLN